MFEELFSRRGLSLDRLHSFLRVADAGSIAKAAGNDPIRQSQFSRQIGELEEFFGVRLTQRHGRSMALTEAGMQLAALIRAHLGSLDDFLKHQASQPVDIRIGAGDSLITWVLLPRIAELQRIFPRANVRLYNLRSWDIMQQVSELRLDFGLARSNLVNAPLEHTLIGKVNYRLFIPARFRKLTRQFTPTELLSRLPLATLGSDTEFFEALVRGAEKRADAVRFRLVTESFPQAARAVMSGQYAAILPAHAATDLPGVLQFELPFLRGASRSVSLVWNPRLVRTRIDGPALRDQLKQNLRSAWPK